MKTNRVSAIKRLPWEWGPRVQPARPLPHGVPSGATLATRSVTTSAPRESLYLWLCQLRRAPFSYDLLDNFGRRSPRTADPAMTEVEPGDSFMDIFTLIDLEPGRSLTLHLKPSRPVRVFGPIVVQYRIDPLSSGQNQLSGLLWLPPVGRLLPRLRRRALAWGDLIMMRKQLLTLTRLAQRQPLA